MHVTSTVFSCFLSTQPSLSKEDSSEERGNSGAGMGSGGRGRSGITFSTSPNGRGGDRIPLTPLKAKTAEAAYYNEKQQQQQNNDNATDSLKRFKLFRRDERQQTSSSDVAQTASHPGPHRMRRSNSPVCRRRENRLTRISLSIVWLFLFCHFWKLIPTAYEMALGNIDEGPWWLGIVQDISHGLIVLNSSVNFLIYVAL